MELLMRSHIILRCRGCGNAMLAKRDETDPIRAIEVSTSFCNICEDVNGGDRDVVEYVPFNAMEIDL